MENVLNVVKTAALVVCVLYTLVSISYSIGAAIYVNVYNKKKASVRKQQIEIGKSVNDRFAEMEKELESMRRLMQSRYDKNANKIKQLEKAVDEKFELLNKQPEQKKDDSPIGGIISGLLSGALSGVLANVLSKDSKPMEPLANKPKQSKDCYGIQNKATGEVLEPRFEGLYEAWKWLKDNGLNSDDYQIGIVKQKENTPDENQEKDISDESQNPVD